MRPYEKWMLTALTFGWGAVAPLAAEDMAGVPAAAVAAYPRPPKAVAADGKLFLGYYAQLWFKADYAGMYGALSGEARECRPFEKFAAALDERRKINGGVKGFGDVKMLRDDGHESEWSLAIEYVRTTAAPLKVRVTLVKDVDAWTVKEGGLLPLDEALFDR